MSLPILTTRRLVLRALDPGDAEAMESLCGRDFEVARWLTSLDWPYEDGAAEAFLQDTVGTEPPENDAVFAITLGGVFIGVVAIDKPGDLDAFPDDPTLGYWLGRKFHGFGYATEAVQAVLAFGFEAFDAPMIGARAYEDNFRSRGLLRKLGFKPAGICERYAKPLDCKVRNIVVRLNRSDFEMVTKAA